MLLNRIFSWEKHHVRRSKKNSNVIVIPTRIITSGIFDMTKNFLTFYFVCNKDEYRARVIEKRKKERKRRA